MPVILETRRLALRQFTAGDVDNLFSLNSDPEVMRYLEKCGLTLVRTTPYRGADPVEGAEHGEVEYALTRPAADQARMGGARLRTARRAPTWVT